MHKIIGLFLISTMFSCASKEVKRSLASQSPTIKADLNCRLGYSVNTSKFKEDRGKEFSFRQADGAYSKELTINGSAIHLRLDEVSDKIMNLKASFIPDPRHSKKPIDINFSLIHTVENGSNTSYLSQVRVNMGHVSKTKKWLLLKSRPLAKRLASIQGYTDPDVYYAGTESTLNVQGSDSFKLNLFSPNAGLRGIKLECTIIDHSKR